MHSLAAVFSLGAATHGSAAASANGPCGAAWAGLLRYVLVARFSVAPTSASMRANIPASLHAPTLCESPCWKNVLRFVPACCSFICQRACRPGYYMMGVTPKKPFLCLLVNAYLNAFRSVRSTMSCTPLTTEGQLCLSSEPVALRSRKQTVCRAARMIFCMHIFTQAYLAVSLSPCFASWCVRVCSEPVALPCITVRACVS